MLKQYFKKSFTENRLAIYISIAILLISLILGYVLEPYLYAYFNPVVEDLTNKVETGVIQLTFNDIFLNNIVIVFQMFFYGILFCLCGVILAFNGFFVGYYVGTSDNFFRVLMYLIPHGIFEFSSCILACASGFVLFNFIFNVLKSYLGDNSFKQAVDVNFEKLIQSVIILTVSVVLMIIAGFVEVYLTIPIANFIMGV